MSRWKNAFISAAIGASVLSVALLASISKSTNSTAAISVLFVPFVVAVFAIPFLAFGYCVSDLISLIKGKSAKLSIPIKVRALIATLLGAWGTYYVGYNIVLTNAVNEINAMQATDLDAYIKDSSFRNNKFVLGAIVQNPNVSEAVLDQIAKTPEPELHERMGSIWPIMGTNGKGLAVMRLIVRHPNVSPSTLEYLARTSTVDYVLSDIAANPKTSMDTLIQLETKNDYLIDVGLAQNNKAPISVMRKLLDRKKEYVLTSLADNPAAPLDIKRQASVLLAQIKESSR